MLKKTILLWFFFFFLIIDLFFLTPTVIVQIFSPIEELIIPIGISKKDAKRTIETHVVIGEAKESMCSIDFKNGESFL